MKTMTFNYCILFCLGCSLLLSFAGCGKQNETAYTLKGRLSNLETPYIYLVTGNNDSILLDTIRTDRKGNFSYKSQTENLLITTLFFDGKPKTATVFINKGWDIEIEGNADCPNLIYVTGGNENNDLTAFKKEHASLFKYEAELLLQMSKASAPDSLQNYVGKFKSIHNELTGKAWQYIEKNTDKIAGIVLIRDFLKNNGATTSRLDTILSMLTGEAATFPLTIELKEYNEQIKLSQTGAKAPEFVFKNAKKEIKSQDYNGKYLLINLFSTQKDSLSVSDFILNVNEYKRLKDKNIEFLSVILCDHSDCHVPDSIKWKVFCEPKGWASPFIKAYNIPETPHNILISPAGFILEQGASPVPLIEKMEEEIAKKEEFRPY